MMTAKAFSNGFLAISSHVFGLGLSLHPFTNSCMKTDSCKELMLMLDTKSARVYNEKDGDPTSCHL